MSEPIEPDHPTVQKLEQKDADQQKQITGPANLLTPAGLTAIASAVIAVLAAYKGQTAQTPPPPLQVEVTFPKSVQLEMTFPKATGEPVPPPAKAATK